MFANMVAGLRKEAEKVSAANYLLLANSHDNSNSIDGVTGRAAREKTKISGVLMSGGGILGLIGVAVANQAAALGAAGMLTSASAAMAGLGTVAVGTAVLPFVTVAAVGVAVSGIAVMGISQLMSVDVEKGFATSKAIQANDLDGLKKLGSQDVGVSDWLRGAKNFVVKSLQEKFLGNSARVVEVPAQPDWKQVVPEEKLAQGGNAISLYELEDLLGENLEDSAQGKKRVVDLVAGDAWDKLGVVIADEKIHECLSQTRSNETCIGKILAVDKATGLVTQSMGRGRATIHNLKDFDKVPVVGQDADISYRDGKMQVQKNLGNEREAGRSVGR
ncbi:hypothetical protein [Janthinobacterium sp. CAN_S7]|uniref:KfrB domain-containing protein n=1 Tax=Janthinobacterium sp. CAN_S7 TaxID=3071704 RepID=UPI00319DD286